MNLQQQKIMELDTEIQFLQKMQKKLNLQRAWGQEIQRVINEEISLMQWQKNSHLEAMQETESEMGAYTPAQPPQKDIFSLNMEKEIRDRFHQLKSEDAKTKVESLV